jgi:hypothetical protein
VRARAAQARQAGADAQGHVHRHARGVRCTRDVRHARTRGSRLATGAWARSTPGVELELGLPTAPGPLCRHHPAGLSVSRGVSGIASGRFGRRAPSRERVNPSHLLAAGSTSVRAARDRGGARPARRVPEAARGLRRPAPTCLMRRDPRP